MEPLVTTRAALLLALRLRPGYGRELVRRTLQASGGRVRLSEARVYSALARLSRQGLVEPWQVLPPRARGARRRTYYGLTPRGVEACEDVRRALSPLLEEAERPRLDKGEARRMAERLRRGDELSRFANRLRSAMLPAGKF